MNISSEWLSKLGSMPTLGYILPYPVYPSDAALLAWFIQYT